MKPKLLLILIIVLSFISNAHAQGMFSAITIGSFKNGMLGIRTGYTVNGIFEVYGSYNPKITKFNNPGFFGGTIKVPIYYKTISDNYESALIGGFFVDYTYGKILLPDILSGNNSKINQTTIGRAPAIGIELMHFGNNKDIVIPIEIGYGKLHFNQQFYKQTPDPLVGYEMKSNLFMMIGAKVYFSRSNCDKYIENLRAGN